MKFEQETKLIIRAFYNTYGKLGHGFLEKVYENSMMIELEKLGLSCQAQVPVKVYYDNNIVGNYFADIIVKNKIILELKAAENLCAEHEAQLLNYLKATNFEVGLLFNFGKRPQLVRKIYDNEFKFNNRTRINTDKTDFNGY